MNQNEHQKSQAIRELEWLATFFTNHGREDIAEEIFQQVKQVRQKAQSTLTVPEASDVVNFGGGHSNEENIEGA